jgi:hypothetical protein
VAPTGGVTLTLPVIRRPVRVSLTPPKGRTQALKDRAVEMLARGLSVRDKLTILAPPPTLTISEWTGAQCHLNL